MSPLRCRSRPLAAVAVSAKSTALAPAALGTFTCFPSSGPLARSVSEPFSLAAVDRSEPLSSMPVAELRRVFMREGPGGALTPCLPLSRSRIVSSFAASLAELVALTSREERPGTSCDQDEARCWPSCWGDAGTDTPVSELVDVSLAAAALKMAAKLFTAITGFTPLRSPRSTAARLPRRPPAPPGALSSSGSAAMLGGCPPSPARLPLDKERLLRARLAPGGAPVEPPPEALLVCAFAASAASASVGLKSRVVTSRGSWDPWNPMELTELWPLGAARLGLNPTGLSPLGLPASLSLLAQASSKDCVRYRRGLLRAMPRGPTTPPSVARRDFGLPRNRLLFPNPFPRSLPSADTELCAFMRAYEGPLSDGP
mmetsp:Transcript_16837/g.50284  ORF Transcript_16837/g.50284 Transcript_16837/m.50284 type:complete len:371 (+) Transcript_16837:108-1220(+)